MREGEEEIPSRSRALQGVLGAQGGCGNKGRGWWAGDFALCLLLFHYSALAMPGGRRAGLQARKLVSGEMTSVPATLDPAHVPLSPTAISGLGKAGRGNVLKELID